MSQRKEYGKNLIFFKDANLVLRREASCWNFKKQLPNLDTVLLDLAVIWSHLGDFLEWQLAASPQQRCV